MLSIFRRRCESCGSTDIETGDHYGGSWHRCRRCHPEPPEQGTQMRQADADLFAAEASRWESIALRRLALHDADTAQKCREIAAAIRDRITPTEDAR